MYSPQIENNKLYSFVNPFLNHIISTKGVCMAISNKIKKARIMNGWTQAQLATIVGLAVPRIKQYESGARTPSPELLKVFIDALGVSEEYFHEHSVETAHDVMHSLFEIEDTFGLDIIEANGDYLIHIKNPTINAYLKEWKDERTNSYLSTETKEDYIKWKTTFPKKYIEKISRKLNESRNKNMN